MTGYRGAWLVETDDIEIGSPIERFAARETRWAKVSRRLKDEAAQRRSPDEDVELRVAMLTYLRVAEVLAEAEHYSQRAREVIDRRYLAPTGGRVVLVALEDGGDAAGA